MTKFSTLLRPTFPLLIAGSLLAIGAPAFAKDLITNSDVREQQQSDQPDQARKYCAARTVSGEEGVTGTILSRKVCKTRAQWEAMGVRIDAK